MTGYRLELLGVEHFLDALTLTKFAAGAAVATVLLISRPRFKGPLAQPIQLLACASCWRSNASASSLGRARLSRVKVSVPIRCISFWKAELSSSIWTMDGQCECVA